MPAFPLAEVIYAPRVTTDAALNPLSTLALSGDLTVAGVVSGASGALAPQVYPKRASMFYDEAITVQGSGWTIFKSVQMKYGWWAYNTSLAQNDTTTLSFMLRAGTYTLWTYGTKGPANGLLDYYIDNVLVYSGQDWYAAAYTYDQTMSLADIPVATDGYHVLKIVIPRTSGSYYGAQLTKIWFVPKTGD